MQIIMTSAHAGFSGMGHPLGGGATIAEAFTNYWEITPEVQLHLFGAGPVHSLKFYTQIKAAVLQAPHGSFRSLPSLSTCQYAQFCREFSQHLTARLEQLTAAGNLRESIVLSHDISEGPDFQLVRKMGFKVVTIFHVDVVDYFCRIYLGSVVKPQYLTSLFRTLQDKHFAGWMPQILKLVFEKQQACVRHSNLIIVPSSIMKEQLLACYPDEPHDKFMVLPWGQLPQPLADEQLIKSEIEAFKQKVEWQDGDILLLTMSRISPEKGVHLLLEALILAEKQKSTHPWISRIKLIIAGAPAFMMGDRYMKKLKDLSQRLKAAKVIFAGHVLKEQKAALLNFAHLYVFPSIHESYGLTLVEALSAGLPVLSTNHYSAADLVNSSRGLIVNASARSLLHGLHEMVRSPELLKKYCLHRSPLPTFENQAGILTNALRRLVHT